jgi:N-acetylglucosaminyl-diphospho-decaprenol L-rhamnosyltransferase
VLRGLERTVPQLRALGDGVVYVVDNCSPDDSLSVLREGIAARGFEDRVRLIVSPSNGGFGAGNNVAFRASMESNDPAELFFLLNPDAWPEEGCIAALVSFFGAHPEVGAAGGRLLDEQGVVHPSVFRFPSLWSELEGHVHLGVVSRLAREHVVALPTPPQSRPVDWVSGASMVVRRRVLDEVGLFDEGFFLYFEEVDLCRRIHEAGHPIWFVREASVVHIGGVTTGLNQQDRRLPAYWFASRSRYLQKAFGARTLLATNVAAASGFAVHRLRDVLARKRHHNPHYLRDFVRHNFLAPLVPKRGTSPSDD